LSVAQLIPKRVALKLWNRRETTRN